eukprot:GHVN01006473.1.p1 GENE.GHVN01006473.1~~GHVN01006473.1.p1  ORF type:complete len:306 (-),score=43.07 GHVN01006473.1:299-1216(-)
MEDGYETAINWAGGLHHAKRRSASGFCYVNDCVLGILEMLKYRHRVLYVDIDVHHGDGVEEAFYTTPRVMSVSFHKYGDYFPGTGSLLDIGVGCGRGYSISVPLQEGCGDRTFTTVFKRVMDLVMSNYRPESVVLQSGADSLSGDRLGCFNLSLEGHSYASKYFRHFGIPVLVVGGGGYTISNVAKCWTYESAAMCGVCPNPYIPTTSAYSAYYGPDFVLNVRKSNMQDRNETKHIDQITQVITENVRDFVYPVCATVSALKDVEPPVKTFEREDEPVPDVTGDNQSPEPHFYDSGKDETLLTCL